MPGKVNPVMPELLKLVSMRVSANALAVELAAREGQLQLNAYEPLVGVAVLESQTLLSNTLDAVRTRCVEGITVNQRTLERHLAETVGIVTALNPVIGYDRASELAREAYETNAGSSRSCASGSSSPRSRSPRSSTPRSSPVSMPSHTRRPRSGEPEP